jgi:hypothetical protein
VRVAGDDLLARVNLDRVDSLTEIFPVRRVEPLPENISPPIRGADGAKNASAVG